MPHPLPTAQPAPFPVRWRRADNDQPSPTLTAAAVPVATYTATPSAAPSASNRPNGNNGFYNNQLFYILIAVLGAFALISIVNLARTRRRRRIIMREADRLGLMVPGMPGYVPMRERPAFTKADGWRTPDWWEVEPDEEGGGRKKGGASGSGSGSGTGAGTGAGAGAAVEDAGEKSHTPGMSSPSPIAEKSELAEVDHVETDPRTLRQDTEEDPTGGEYGVRGRLELPPLDQLAPLALIPQPEVIFEPPKPWSAIPYFPNYVSYLRSAHDPKPPRFAPNDPHAFDSLIGDQVQVVVALRMPTREGPKPEGHGEDDDDAVIREWSGLELGVASVMVQQ